MFPLPCAPLPRLRTRLARAQLPLKETNELIIVVVAIFVFGDFAASFALFTRFVH
jgi:hypothetical protein